MKGADVRVADIGDAPQLLELWSLVYDDVDSSARPTWRNHARAWFAGVVGNGAIAHFPVVEIDGVIVATAIGTLELGVPNPHCPRGRAVRLANVITLPTHRGHGYATSLVAAVVDWARSVHADRIDLSATPAAQGIYERAGFVRTSAPRMKLVLTDEVTSGDEHGST